MVVKIGWFLFLTLCLAGSSGCAKYRALPLAPAAIEESLKPPTEEALRIEAKKIRHPILKPMALDLQDGLSPDEAAMIAVLVNPRLRAARDQKGIAAAQLLQAGILPNPQFSFSLDFPTGGNRQDTINAFGLGLNWDFRSLLLRGAAIDTARAHAASVDLDIAWQEWQVAQGARLHVIRLFFLGKQIDVAREEAKSLRERLGAIEKAVQLGDMTVIDLAAAKAALQQADSSMLALEQKQKQEQLSLNQALGFPPERSVPLQSKIPLPSPQAIPSYAQAVKGIEERRLDLLALKIGYQSQEAKLREAVRAQFPRISIGISHARDVSNVITTGFSISIGLPFFDRNQGGIAREKASRQQLFDEYIDRIFEARSSIAHILANMESVKKQIRLAEESIPTLKNLVQTYYLALLEGNADVLSYYNALGNLFSKRLEVLQLNQTFADLNNALEIAAGRYIAPEERKEQVPK